MDERVVHRMYDLTLQSWEDVARRFAEVPVEFAEDTSGFFRSLRLLTTSHCVMHCQYPDERVMWCHNEGMARNGIKPSDMSTMARIVRHCLQRYGITHVTLAGLQPLLDEDLLRFIAAICAMGITKVSFTSHGWGLLPWLEHLRDAGLTDITLSVQAFAVGSYQAIMGRDAFANVVTVVDTARQLGLPVAINRVILRGHTDDIPHMLAWVRRDDLRVRLYDVMWQPGHDEYFLKYFISWQELIDHWEHVVERITVWTYTRSGRVNIVFWLSDGGSIETNLPLPPRKADANVCRSCWMAPACTEGYLGCGIRITPDYMMKPCLLRGDMNVPLLPIVERGPSDPLNAALDTVLLGDWSPDPTV
ncbi:MAG: radical SAM protein [Egibacteraceae bacterium]